MGVGQVFSELPFPVSFRAMWLHIALSPVSGFRDRYF